MMRFNLEENLKFVEMVSEFPSLYHPKDMSYTDTLLKDSIWDIIGQKFGKNPEICKTHWRTLKDSYNRFKRQSTVIRSETQRTKYTLYKNMTFLDEIGIQNKRTNNHGNKRKGRGKKKDSKEPIVVGIEHAMFHCPTAYYELDKGMSATDFKALIKPIEKKSQGNVRIKPPRMVFDKESHEETEVEKTEQPQVITQNMPKIQYVDENVDESIPIFAKWLRFVREQKKEHSTLTNQNDAQNNTSNYTDSTDINTNVTENGTKVIEASSSNEIISNNASSINNTDINEVVIKQENTKELKEDLNKTRINFIQQIETTLKTLPPVFEIQTRQALLKTLADFENKALTNAINSNEPIVNPDIEQEAMEDSPDTNLVKVEPNECIDFKEEMIKIEEQSLLGFEE